MRSGSLRIRKRQLRRQKVILISVLSSYQKKICSKAADVLASVHPLELFRIGYSSGLKLKNKLKEYIIKHGEQILSFTDVACSEVISGLLEKRPKYFEGLKEKGSITLRDFKNISEIKYTDDAVNGLIFSNKLIFECFELDQEYLAGAFQDKVQNNSASITYISLFNTMLVNNICKGCIRS